MTLTLSRLSSVAFFAFALTSQVHAADFTVTSPTIKDQGNLPKLHVLNGFGCTGDNKSPELNWTNVPEGTQSFAITAFDPDAPTDSGWWHWVAINIPATSRGVKVGASTDANALPAGTIQLRSDFGNAAFGGACPPENTKPHKYVFSVYALKVKTIGIPADSSAALTSFMIKANAIAKSSITAYYGR
jgi:Raf kinase inhibitor-like YbhB/YbcL family protein